VLCVCVCTCECVQVAEKVSLLATNFKIMHDPTNINLTITTAQSFGISTGIKPTIIILITPITFTTAILWVGKAIMKVMR
jgi:hypothetical protein